jgi:hypothetical protein
MEGPEAEAVAEPAAVAGPVGGPAAGEGPAARTTAAALSRSWASSDGIAPEAEESFDSFIMLIQCSRRYIFRVIYQFFVAGEGHTPCTLYASYNYSGSLHHIIRTLI